jgi:arylsulfatase
MGAATLAFGSYAGIGQGGTGVLKVDGKDVVTQKMEHTVPFILQFDESLDLGSDTLTGVNDADYQPPFAFTGKLNKVTLTIDRPKLTPEDEKKLMDAERNKAASQ